MVYNMYDGFYIFGPTYVPETAKDDQGMDKTTEYLGEKKLVYKNTSGGETLNVDEANKVCEYTLSPKTPYSAHYVTEDGETDIIVEYTLDNYITVRGKIDGMQYENSGYFTYFGIEGTEGISSTLTTRGGIQYLGADVKPEKLTETVIWEDDEGIVYEESLNYVYNVKQKKCYTNDNGVTWFYIGKDKKKKNIPENEAWKTIFTYDYGIKCIQFMTLDGKMYKDMWTDLYNDNGYIDDNGEMQSVGDGIAYIDRGEGSPDGILDSLGTDGMLDTEMNQEEKNAATGGYSDPIYDFSAINYYIASKEFSDEINSKLGKKELYICNLVYNEGKYEYKEEKVGKIFKLEQKNNPESSKSKLYKHKSAIITNLINLSINSAISNYSNNSGIVRNIPKISYDDMNNAIGNLSIFAFLIDLPMGYKTYNDYSYATSNANNDFVNLKSLKYIDNTQDDEYCHYIYCNKLKSEDVTAYISFEFKKRMHNNISNLECYNCIINRGIMEKIDIGDLSGADSGLEKIYNRAYLEALGRERYRQNYNGPDIDDREPQPLKPESDPTPEIPEGKPNIDISTGSDVADTPAGGGDGALVEER